MAPAAAFREGAVQLVVVPDYYSENIGVLVEELARNVGQRTNRTTHARSAYEPLIQAAAH